VDHWLEAREKGIDWKPVYFLIDECPLFLSPPKKGDPDFEIRTRIIRIASHLAMRGRYVGLFQILGTQDLSWKRPNAKGGSDIQSLPPFLLVRRLESNSSSICCNTTLLIFGFLLVL